MCVFLIWHRTPYILRKLKTKKKHYRLRDRILIKPCQNIVKLAAFFFALFLNRSRVFAFMRNPKIAFHPTFYINNVYSFTTVGVVYK